MIKSVSDGSEYIILIELQRVKKVRLMASLTQGEACYVISEKKAREMEINR